MPYVYRIHSGVGLAHRGLSVCLSVPIANSYLWRGISNVQLMYIQITAHSHRMTGGCPASQFRCIS